MLLPFFRENGWQPTVLAVQAEQVAAPQDPWLEEGLPKDVEVIRVKARGLGWSRIPGLGTLDYRALGALRRAGNALLQARHFDLIYFSTTVFGVHVLGSWWKRRFGVPFAMDYQDPWVSDYYDEHPEITPPGGRLKYAVTQWLAKRNEPGVLKACSGITSVSPDYPRQLNIRYPELNNYESLVLPFPGSKRDLERIGNGGKIGYSYDTDMTNWIYVGVSGPYMNLSVSALFSAMKAWSENDLGVAENIKLHFIGTSYAPAGSGTPSILPIAERYGLADRVVEQTDRVPYSEMLRLLKTADALIVPGSDDPAYTASKIYPYLLARRPLLCIFHENSSVVELIDKVGGGVVVSFGNNDTTERIAERVYQKWLVSGAHRQVMDLDKAAFEPYTDRASAARLCEFFDKLVC